MIDNNNKIVLYKDICSSYILNIFKFDITRHRLEYYMKYLINIEFEVPNV